MFPNYLPQKRRNAILIRIGRDKTIYVDNLVHAIRLVYNRLKAESHTLPVMWKDSHDWREIDVNRIAAQIETSGCCFLQSYRKDHPVATGQMAVIMVGKLTDHEPTSAERLMDNIF